MALAPQDTAGPERDTAIRLVVAHRSGDAAAFTEIVRSHYPTLLACARRRLTNPQDAEDAVQEAFLRAYRRLGTFGSEGDWRLGAWLNTILGNVCLDILSRRRPSAPYDESIDRRLEERPDAADLISDSVALDAIARAIATLPQSQRSAFLLRMVDDRPYDEVAATLGITEDNARARVARARSALQRALARSDALTGMLAAAPLLLVGSFRSGLRRIFSSNAGNSAHATAATAASSVSTNVAGAANAAATAEAAVSGGGLGAGMQMLGQLASTPVAQVALATSTATGGRGSAVLGVVASLAAAGGLSVPAVAAVGAPTPAAASVAQTAPHQVTATAPVTSRTTSPALSAPASPTPKTSAVTATTSPEPSHVATAPPEPSWVAVAASASVFGAAKVTSEAPTSAGGSKGSTGASLSTGTASTSQGSPSSTSAPAPEAPTPATTTRAGGAALAIGTCTGISGFPGVTTPTSVPPLSSDALVAFMSTGAHAFSPTGGGPGFQTTGSMSQMGSSTTPVHVKVGTCLAAAGSILALDMTGTTGNEVQLVGSLVSQPATSATGSLPKGTADYLFRGHVTQLAGTSLPGGRLPWNLSSGFVAELQVQPGNVASVDVVFIKTVVGAEPTPSQTSSSTTSTTARTTGPSTTTTAGGSPSATSTTAGSTTTSTTTTSSSTPAPASGTPSPSVGTTSGIPSTTSETSGTTAGAGAGSKVATMTAPAGSAGATTPGAPAGAVSN